ncbi:MAG: TonB-dependent receptor [Steroidobacteraceae bacterium]
MKGHNVSAAGFAVLLAMGAASGISQMARAADSGESAALEEVVITAERREADVQKSAIAIAVISGDQLDAGGVSSTAKLLDLIPGLDITHANINSNISLRGLASGASTQYADPVMAFNIGGVPLGRQFAASGAMYDLQRVEVLKGPQGTLYGRNATVGAINLIPNLPTQEFGGSVSAELGNYDTTRLTGVINMPLSANWATRLAVATNRHSGYLSDGYDDADNQAARLSALYKPDERFSLLLWSDYYRDNSKGGGSVFRYVNPGQEWQVPGNPWFAFGAAGCGDTSRCPIWADSAGPGGTFVEPFRSRSVVGDDGYVDLKQLITAAQLDWKIGNDTLTVIPAVVRTHAETLSYSSGLTWWPMQDIDQQSLEARLASDTEARLRWVVGAMYYHERIDALLRTLEPNGWQLVRTPDLTDTSGAAFGEATYSVAPRLRVTGGLRYTSERKSQDGFTLLDGAFTATTCPSPGVFVTGATTAYGYYYPVGYCQVPNGGSLKFTDTSWKLGVEFDVAAESLLYANARTGFKAGGLAPALPPNTYKPEKLTAYELGSKNRFFDERLQANLEVFYWDYKDQQISVLHSLNPAGQAGWPVNVPGWVKGAELALDAAPTTADRLHLDVLFEKGKYELYPTVLSTSGSLGGLVDYPRINLPEWSISGGAEHRFTVSTGGAVVLGADAHYESGTWLRPVAYAARRIGDYREAFITEDLSFGYEAAGDRWSVTGFVNNLSNEAVISTGTSGGVSTGTFYRPPTNAADARYATLQPPRTYGIRFAAKF